MPLLHFRSPRFLLFLVILAGCNKLQPQTKMPYRDIDSLLNDLRNDDAETRKNARMYLVSMRHGSNKISGQDAAKLLRAGADPQIRRHQKSDNFDFSEYLVDAASAARDKELYPIIVECFPQLSDGGKWYAQTILAPFENREAAETYMQIVRLHAPKGQLPRLLVRPIMQKPSHADVLFPELLKYADRQEIAFDIYNLCLTYCQAKLLTLEAIAPFEAQILGKYQAIAEQLRPKQQMTGVAWMWQEDYYNLRAIAGLLLDLMQFFPNDQVNAELRQALEFRDPRLKYFAAVSLLKRGLPVAPEHLLVIAASPETRTWLYTVLKDIGKIDLFPKQFFNQAAFAESDLVQWLTYPTELGRVPDEIELMKVVPIDTGLPGGIYDYYLFRFRTDSPDFEDRNVWIAGVSGPFLRSDTPATNGLGDTFSGFAKWDEKSPDEHIGDIRELMERWREHHSKE